jgi:hypothetical protein
MICNYRILCIRNLLPVKFLAINLRVFTLYECHSALCFKMNISETFQPQSKNKFLPEEYPREGSGGDTKENY